ncbi:MAG: AraC family transcriptional regulator [Lentisphaerae bacterium]|nr:MAG: AraC family transcriptional regulator [Lentisphaerota bacterium]
MDQAVAIHKPHKLSPPCMIALDFPWRDRRGVAMRDCLQIELLEYGTSERHGEFHHEHPNPPLDRLFYFREGGAQVVSAAGEELRLEPGNVYLLPAGFSFSITYGPSYLSWYHLHLRNQSHLTLFNQSHCILVQSLPAYAAALFEGVPGQFPVAQLLCALAMLILNWEEDMVLSLEWHRSIPAGLRNAVDRVMRDPLFTISVDELAVTAQISRATLVRQFRHYYGTSPRQFVLAECMRRACHMLLATKDPAEAIADRLGFPHSSYFYRVFRKKMGVSPQTFRAIYRETS